uniref:Uncharacterized protein n=1 Tax=Ditylenchus dipsaci TaxID=166011 RepID=A0A915EFU5_9BILA
MRSPKELTPLFEELSRSSEFQEEYDRLRSEVDAAESNAQSNLNKRRDIALEKREAKQEAGEAKKYTTLKEELLYFVEFSRNAAFQQLEALRDENEHKVTREDRKVVKPVVTQLKQQMGHMKSKRTDAEKKHLTAQKIAEDYSRNVDLAKQIEQESQSKQLNLNPEQVAEYRRLKTEFEKKSIEETQNLDNKRQEQLTDQNAIEYEKRHRHRAIALDGTQFQPNGIISGGGMDLKARAKTWDDKAINAQL